MSLIKCELDKNFSRGILEGEGQQREYPLQWKAIFNDISTDSNYVGTQVLALCRSKTPWPTNIPKFDAIPKIGNQYNFLGHSDSTARCTNVTCDLEDEDNPLIWVIKATFKQPDNAGGGGLGAFIIPDPLQWPVFHWMEFIEDQSIVEVAYCLEELDHLKRGLNFASEPDDPINEPGPIINGAGQQTIDPHMETKHRMILNSLVYYPNGIYGVALQNQFENTVHCHTTFLEDPTESPGDVPLFVGCPHYTWKFLSAVPDKVQFREIEGSDEVVEYYPTTIRLEFKKGEWVPFAQPGGLVFIWSGWIKLILNNGQLCFRKWFDDYLGLEETILDPRTGKPMLLPTTALQIREDFDLGYDDPRSNPTSFRPQPTMDDMIEVPTSEPVNLHKDGTQITDPETPANYLKYLNLRQANYYDITDYFGNTIYPEGVTLPTFPLSPPP